MCRLRIRGPLLYSQYDYYGRMTEEHTPPPGSMDDTHKSLDEKLTAIHNLQRLTFGLLVAFFAVDIFMS